MSKVTVLMPFFNGSKFVSETIESVMAQSFKDWEFLIISEPESEAEGLDIITRYAEQDARVIHVVNETRLGIARSLNKGLEMAGGKYVARVDADDPSYPARFQKQVEFMDAHPDISICGSYTRDLTPDGQSIQKLPSDPEELKASLLFGCDLAHCSLMLRRSDFIDNGWRYDPNHLSEDFHLWLSIMDKAKFANLPEALACHRWGFVNISLDKGEDMLAESSLVSAGAIKKYLDIETDKYDLSLFRGWRSKPSLYSGRLKADFLKNGFALLEEMERQNTVKNFVQPGVMSRVLRKKWDWICASCGLPADEDIWRRIPREKPASTPAVSVLLPIYNSAAYLRTAIDSIINQTFKDWELLAINEAGSDDGSAEIVKYYAKHDPRIRLIQNEERLGLAESLNLGLRAARGQYVARLDADDASYPDRLKKQKAFLDRHPEVGVLGGWQRHHDNGKEIWIHQPPSSADQCRANLTFWCDLCHSTLMLRRQVFVDNDLYYDPSFMAEDYELWTRAIEKTEFANLPEIVGDYRRSGQNITDDKRPLLGEEGARITAATLKRIFRLDLTPEEFNVLKYLTWVPGRFMSHTSDRTEIERNLRVLKGLFQKIWAANAKINFLKGRALLKSMQILWEWATFNRVREEIRYPVHTIEALFNPKHRPTFAERWERFCRANPGTRARAVGILKKGGRTAKKNWRAIFGKSVEQWTWDRFLRTSKKLDQMHSHFDREIWNLEKMTLANHVMLTDWTFERHKPDCKPGDKIRIGFFFQIPSFWASLEALYKALCNDDRFEPVVIYCDENLDPSIKTEGVVDFLESRNMPAVSYKDFDLNGAKLHCMVMQTIWDENRPPQYSLSNLKSMGARLIFTSYGVEFPDTELARKDHYERPHYLYFWRIYTFSPKMLPYYNTYGRNSRAVRALGAPRFDSIFHSEEFSLAEDLKEQKGDRRLFLWKVHFPKTIYEKGRNVLVTPDLGEYLEFVNFVKSRPDLFFVFMPHPRFVEFNSNKHLADQAHSLFETLRAVPNVYIDVADDYRPTLLHADHIIVDRSAVMVEAGASGAPVLFMRNAGYKEPLTDALRPLIESYYQGSTCDDMVEFVEMCLRGEDDKKEERLAAWRECMPLFDGRASERIKDDIADSIMRGE